MARGWRPGLAVRIYTSRPSWVFARESLADKDKVVVEGEIAERLDEEVKKAGLLNSWFHVDRNMNGSIRYYSGKVARAIWTIYERLARGD